MKNLPKLTDDSKLIASMFPFTGGGVATPMYDNAYTLTRDLKDGVLQRPSFWATLPNHEDCTFGIKFTNRNESMAPHYPRGCNAWLICREASRSLWLEDGTIQYLWGEVHMVLTDDHAYVGRLCPCHEQPTTHVTVVTDGGDDTDIAMANVKGVYVVKTDIIVRHNAY